MAQQVKWFATRFNKLKSRIRRVERTNSGKLPSDLHTFTVTCVHICVHIHILIQNY